MSDIAVLKVLEEGLEHFTHDWRTQPNEPDQRCYKCGEWELEVGLDSPCLYETAEILQWFEDKIKEFKK